MRKILFAAAFLTAVFCSGCISPDNNYLEARDFADFLKRDGLPVSDIKLTLSEPFGASSAVSIKVGDSEVGVYKYDRNAAGQRKRLERIARAGRVHFSGLPYPVEVWGSFMFIGLERNKHKRAILKTIKKFR